MARWAIVAVVLCAIEVVVRLNLVDRIFLTSPSLIATAAWDKILSGELIILIATTLYEAAIAFLLVVIVGLPAGYLLWKYPLFGRAYDELLGAFFACPIILLYPIFLVVFGRGMNAIIAMGFISGIIPVVLNAHQGLRDVNSTYIKVGKSMRLSENQIITHILFPAAWPIVIGGLKLGLTFTLISVVALEFLVDIGGIGTLASKAYFWFNTEDLYLGVAAAVFLSMIFSYLVGKAESRLYGL